MTICLRVVLTVGSFRRLFELTLRACRMGKVRSLRLMENFSTICIPAQLAGDNASASQILKIGKRPITPVPV